MFTVPALPAYGQGSDSPSEDTQTQELVDRLQRLIRRAERRRTTAPRILDQLRTVVRQYDWPWQLELLSDTFRDGNYSRNPTWTVESGDFWAQRQSGLRTEFTPPLRRGRQTARQGDDVGTAILGAVLSELQRQEGGQNRAAVPEAAAIHTALPITNAFALKLELLSHSDAQTERLLEIGPYQGGPDGEGYRLVYAPGQRSSFELIRSTRGRSAVIETYDGQLDLEDGRTHNVEWRRDRDGNMTVLVDGEELIRASDRAFREPFDGLTLVNRGGEYVFRRIELFGARQAN